MLSNERLNLNPIEEIKEIAINLNLISVYDLDSYTLQELYYKVAQKINEVIIELNRFEVVINEEVTEQTEILKHLLDGGVTEEIVKKLNLWLEDGTLANIINNNVFQLINNKINEYASKVDKIESEIPYKKYVRGEDIEINTNRYLQHGSTIFANKSYGRYEQGAPLSAIVGERNPQVEVLGTDTQGLSKYTSRDSVALYCHTNWNGEDKINLVGCTFNFDGLVIPQGVDTNKIKVGMIIDTTGSKKCVGIISKVEGQVITLIDGWYEVKTGVGSTIRTTPNGDSCVINNITKLWGINNNVFIREGMENGVNMELGVFCNTPNISEVGGVDLINFEESTHYGYRARGVKIGFQKGFVSEESGVHFEGKNGNSTEPLIQAINKDESVFVIKNDGEVSKVKTVVQTIPSSTTLADNVSVGLISGNNVTVTLPQPERGRILYFYSLGTGNKLLAHPGQTIAFPHVSHQEIPLGSKPCSCQLVSDGTNWYAIATTVTE